MSAQGVRGIDLSGTTFSTLSFRDAADFTRTLREQRVYANYNSNSFDDKNAKPTWLKYGNDFRLSYSFGHFKCISGCTFTPTNVGDAPPLLR